VSAKKKPKRPMSELLAAEAHLQAVKPDITHPYPAWHGWALREAFLAGIDWAKENQK